MSFIARYASTCTGCGTKINPGDECERAGRRAVHYDCADQVTAVLRDIDRDVAFAEDGDDDEPQPVITGQREHARHCGDCNLVHAGECW